MLLSEFSLRLLLATIALTWQVTHCQNARCYDATCDLRGELISSGVSARHCCLELSAGRSYDFGGNQEACHTCEVLGWREENIYVTEGSSVEVSFGTVKGSLSVPYTFQVEVTTNTANISVVSDVNISNIRVVVPSIALVLQVPHYHDAQSYNKTATLRLIQLSPGRKEGQFVYPDVMTLHVIDPEVQFQHSHYSLRYPHSSLIVCLTYYNTVEGVFVQFDSEVLIRGGTFSQVESFNFMRSSRNSCLNITLSLSELDPLTDTEFSADIQLPVDPVFHLGPVSSATITVEAIEEPTMTPTPRPLPPLTFPPPTAPPNSVVDVVTGGALLAVPIKVQSPARSPRFSTSLCYEVHGDVDKYFNLISDSCLSLNAHYSESDPTKPLNSIDEIAAVVTNNEGENLNISVDRHCNFRLNNGPALRYLNSSGVMGVATASLVVISMDNAYCESQLLVMTIECGVDVFGVLKLHVYRDLDMGGSTAHGLVGQFWSRPITIVQYGSNPDHYLIEIPGNTQRQMIGDRHSTTWQREKRQCFYVGDRQGGRGLEIKGAPNEPLIEGVYTDYIMDGPYDTSFTFSRFGK